MIRSGGRIRKNNVTIQRTKRGEDSGIHYQHVASTTNLHLMRSE